MAGLCEGIAVSAERLRILARRQAADARWSPAATAAAWRSTAAAAAAAGHASELVLRSLAASRNGRALEAAAVIAVTPIVTSYSWGTHLVLLLVPILVLVAWGVRRRDWTVLALVAAGYLLLGVGHNRMQTLLVTGYSNLLVLRLMAELGVLGILAIWVAALMAVRRERSSGTITFSTLGSR